MSQESGAPPEPVCAESDLDGQAIHRARLSNGQVVGVARLDTGAIVAFDGQCPHFAGPLWAGRVSGKDVICPWHGFRFDVTTGKVAGMESIMRLRLFRVSVSGGTVYVAPTELPH